MSFDLSVFLPYLLNRAGETVSRDFQTIYRNRYGMLRTEWRVLFHLGLYGELTARQICDLADLHKTKVSRAVQALESKRFLVKRSDTSDRRVEHLCLSEKGRAVFSDLRDAAFDYETKLVANLSAAEVMQLKALLGKLANPRDRF